MRIDSDGIFTSFDLVRLRLPRHTTSYPKSYEVLLFPFYSIALVDLGCRFEIDQDRTTFCDQDISMMTVSMEEAKFVKRFQRSLAFLKVIWPKAFSPSIFFKMKPIILPSSVTYARNSVPIPLPSIFW